MHKFLSCSLFILSFLCVGAQELIWFDNDSAAVQYMNSLTPGFVYKKLSPLQPVYKITPLIPEESINKMNPTNGVRLFQKCHTIDYRGKAPNDPLYGFQYYLNNKYNIGKDIQIENTWTYTTGGTNWQGDTLVIAIVDDGLDTNHLDLQSSLWKNHQEISGDSLDNDSNGYLDDYYGFNISSGNGQILPGSHGTSVAGVSGAAGNNAIGISGVCWKVKLLPVVISGLDEADVVSAYLYILNQRRLYNQSNGKKGAYIVSANSSFGVFQQRPADFPIWCAMYDSLGSEGIISTAATVNASVRIDSYGDVPSMCASNFLMVVSSTDSNDQNCNAGFSPVFVDLSAPGCDIYTTIPGGSYSYVSGTSFAAPQVASAVALLHAAPCRNFCEFSKKFPDSAALLIKKYLLKSTDPLSGAGAQTVSGGRMNVFASLNQLVSDECWSLGLEKRELPLWQRVFPNPADRWIYSEEEIINAVVYNSNGIQVAVFNGKAMSCDELPSGVYFVRNKFQRFSFLVQH